MNGRKARQFGHLRSTVHGPPSRAGWVSICKVLSKWDAGATLEVLDYLEHNMVHWPDELRQPERGLRPSHPGFRLVRDVCDATLMCEMLEHPQNVRVTRYRFNDYSYPDHLWAPLTTSGLLDMATCIESESSFSQKARLVTMLRKLPMPSLRSLKFRGFFFNKSPWEAFFQSPWMSHLESLIVRDANIIADSLDVVRQIDHVLALKRFEMFGWNHFEPDALETLLQCYALENVSHLAFNTVLSQNHAKAMSRGERRWTVLDVASLSPMFAQAMLENHQFSTLHTIRISRPDVMVSATLNHIAQMESLRHLDMRHASLGDRAIHSEWRAPLQSLRFNGCQMTGSVASHFLSSSWLQEVEDLTLIDCSGLKPQALIDALAERQTPLRCLRMVNITMDDAQLEALFSLPALSELNTLYYKQEYLSTSFYEMLVRDSVVPQSCKVRIKSLIQSQDSLRMIQKHFNGR